jgi:NADH-quinone oxidoreductase subunit L
VLTFATLMMFVGATGKSAQIPLYLWLPDAMAGPTPVSALIHAATMVTAGIYLICRLSPLFLLTPITLTAVAWVGGSTALFAAAIGLFQRDIKKVLAYSTVSQLGYMFLGLGSAGFAAGFLHLFTHAWFKALLFLGAGSVIHGMHHQQDLFRMGGLRSKMPITFWTMLVATLCIMGFPGTSGFFSKDEILYLAFQKSPALYAMGLLGAACTAFYMWRLMALAFWGEPRDRHAFDHAQESPATMTAPLVILAIGALLAGLLGLPRIWGGSFAIEGWLEPALTFGRSGLVVPNPEHGSAALAWSLMALSTTVALAAGFLGWNVYRRGTAAEEAFSSRFPVLYRVLSNKFYVDEAVEALILGPARWGGHFLWKAFDVVIIDGIGVNLPGAFTRVGGDLAAQAQTGRVRNYALGMAIGAVLLLWIFLK